MFKIGEKQTLKVAKKVEFGVYLEELNPVRDENGKPERVLLPEKYVPEGINVGDETEVFLYKDSSDRLIATTAEPLITLGKTAVLTVKSVGSIGAFLDWGLKKDLLLPFRQQRGELAPGQEVLVTLYVDSSERLAATMYVDRFFRADSPYRKDDRVRGHVYALKEEIGAFVAVDDRYFGLIPRQELYEKLRVGDEVEVRVLRVREDGKLDLSPRRKAYAQLDGDGEVILAHLTETGGILGVGDKSDASLIRTELSMSKNAFKRAAGRLMKEGKIRIYDDRIEAVSGEDTP